MDRLTEGDLGGGSLPSWGDPQHPRSSLYWGLYDSRRPVGGYSDVWVQLCIRVNEHDGGFDADEMEWVSRIVDELTRRDPQVQIWISPINYYGGGQVCSAIGIDGPRIAAEASDWAVSTFKQVDRGPNLGPLLPEHIGQRDDCHPNSTGELVLGQQLVAFFDNS